MRSAGTPAPSQSSRASSSPGTWSSPAKTVIQTRSGSICQAPVTSDQANSIAPALK